MLGWRFVAAAGLAATCSMPLTSGVAAAQMTPSGNQQLSSKWGILAELAGQDFAVATLDMSNFGKDRVAQSYRWIIPGEVLELRNWGEFGANYHARFTLNDAGGFHVQGVPVAGEKPCSGHGTLEVDGSVRIKCKPYSYRIGRDRSGNLRFGGDRMEPPNQIDPRPLAFMQAHFASSASSSLATGAGARAVAVNAVNPRAIVQGPPGSDPALPPPILNANRGHKAGGILWQRNPYTDSVNVNGGVNGLIEKTDGSGTYISHKEDCIAFEASAGQFLDVWVETRGFDSTAVLQSGGCGYSAAWMFTDDNKSDPSRKLRIPFEAPRSGQYFIWLVTPNKHVGRAYSAYVQEMSPSRRKAYVEAVRQHEAQKRAEKSSGSGGGFLKVVQGALAGAQGMVDGGSGVDGAIAGAVMGAAAGGAGVDPSTISRTFQNGSSEVNQANVDAQRQSDQAIANAKITAGSQAGSSDTTNAIVTGRSVSAAVREAGIKPPVDMPACGGFDLDTLQVKSQPGELDAQLYAMCGAALNYYADYTRAVGQGYGAADLERAYDAHRKAALVANDYYANNRAN